MQNESQGFVAISSDEDCTTATSAPEQFDPWNNPDNIISSDTYMKIEQTIMCGLNPAFLVLGVCGNLVNCLVFVRQGLRDRMNLSLFSLALADMLYIASFSVLGSGCLVREVDPLAGSWWDIHVRMKMRGVFRAFLSTSGLLTLMISVERCLCVLLPMRAARLITTRTTAIIIVAIFTLMQVLCLIFPFENRILSNWDAKNNVTVWRFVRTDFYNKNTEFFDIVGSVIVIGVVPFVSFIGVCVATVITVWKLRQAMTWRESVQAGAGSKSQVALVKMLVIVSLIYIMTTTPSVVLSILRMTIPEFRALGRYHNIFLGTQTIYYCLAMLNSSVNVIVYFFRSSRYRAELGKLLGCSSKVAQPKATSVYAISSSVDSPKQ